MISGAHVVLYSTNVQADRKFFRDVLKFPFVDAGDGWLIFALPPTELAVHPSKKGDPNGFFLMCDDLKATIKALKQKRVKCSNSNEQQWGTVSTVTLPSGKEIGLYQPKHKLAHREYHGDMDTLLKFRAGRSGHRKTSKRVDRV
jgi:catechol 2,3-dioxygenase-like lactoylglutathione lyase family enzyme